jgi:hypothetical protein
MHHADLIAEHLGQWQKAFALLDGPSTLLWGSAALMSNISQEHEKDGNTSHILNERHSRNVLISSGEVGRSLGWREENAILCVGQRHICSHDSSLVLCSPLPRPDAPSSFIDTLFLASICLCLFVHVHPFLSSTCRVLAQTRLNLARHASPRSEFWSMLRRSSCSWPSYHGHILLACASSLSSSGRCAMSRGFFRVVAVQCPRNALRSIRVPY